MHVDVAIIGGGPSGAAAAITLRRYSSLRVSVVEARDYSEPRVGETLGPGIEPLLEYLGVAVQFAAQSHLRAYATAATWGSSQLRRQEFLLTGFGSGWCLDRSSFDRMLIEAARHAGAEVKIGVRVKEV